MGAESIELRELRVFLTAAEELHFGRTAERLGLTPPRVSQTVAALERRVGGRLFDRTSRRVVLTGRGARLRRELAGPHTRLLAAVAQASAPDASVRGELRLGLLGPSSGGPRLPEIVAEFEKRYPRATVQISELPLTEHLDLLRRSEIDLLATGAPVVASDLVVGPVLHVDDRALVVSTHHPLAGSYAVSLEVLGDHPVARPRGWTPAMEEAVIPRRTPSGRPIRRALEVASTTAVYSAVARGEIVHLSTASTRFYSNHPGLVWIPVTDAAPLPSVLVWRGDAQDQRVAAFAEVAASVLCGAPCAGRPAARGPEHDVGAGDDPIELRELRVFLALAQELHFGRTADRLHLTSPRVSQTVAALERRVGGRLFDRTSRRVALTPRGVALHQDVAEPYAQLLAAVGGVRTVDTDLDGELRIGLLGPASGGPRLLDVVARFEQRHPRCGVRILEIAIGDGAEPLRRGEVDVMVGFGASGTTGLAGGPVLGVEDRALVVAADHPLAGRESVSLEVLGDHPVAECEGWTPAMQELIVPLRTPAGRPVVRGLRVGSMGALWAAVARGEIVHLTVEAMRHYSIHPGLVYVPVSDAPPVANSLRWRAGEEDPRVTAFAAVVEEALVAPTTS